MLLLFTAATTLCLFLYTILINHTCSTHCHKLNFNRMFFISAVHLVQGRALAMQAASDLVPSGLMTVFLKHDSKLNLAMHAAREYCKLRSDIADPVCSIANYLFPEVKVIGGHTQVGAARNTSRWPDAYSFPGFLYHWNYPKPKHS